MIVVASDVIISESLHEAAVTAAFYKLAILTINAHIHTFSLFLVSVRYLILTGVATLPKGSISS